MNSNHARGEEEVEDFHAEKDIALQRMSTYATVMGDYNERSERERQAKSSLTNMVSAGLMKEESDWQ